MQMDIHLFTYIRNTDYAMSAKFSLANIQYGEKDAVAIVHFYLHCPKEKGIALESRQLLLRFNHYGDIINNFVSREYISDSYEYRKVVDNSADFHKAEKDLRVALCRIISLQVCEHYSGI